MKVNYTLLLSLILVLSSCSNTFDPSPTDSSPKTNSRDAVVGDYEYQFNFSVNRDYIKGGYSLPTYQKIKIEKSTKNKSGVVICGIHSRFTVELSEATGHFYKAFPNVKIRDVSSFNGKIVGTPDQVTLIGSFSANGELRYRVTLCGIDIVSASATPIKKPAKSDLPN